MLYLGRRRNAYLEGLPLAESEMLLDEIWHYATTEDIAWRHRWRALAGAGASLADVVSCRVFITHFDRDYAAMNAAYAGYFPADRLPARTCVGVTGLARGGLVEIDLIARR